MKDIKYAVVGCGGRIRGLVNHLKKRKGVTLYGGWDPSEANVRQMFDLVNKGKGVVYPSYESLLADSEIDWILVGSPNAFHKEHIIEAFKAGKHVFAEKPLATTIEDCVAIQQAHEESGKLFATGFTLRYATIYRKTKEILMSGALGDIISINASENISPDHGAYIMKNWRRKKELAGPHILEKCVHDLDLINWFTDSVPMRIAAFGGNDMFTEANSHMYGRAKDLFDSANWNTLSEAYDESDTNPFLSDKTIEDNVVSIMEYASGVKVQFQATMCNTLPERRMYIHCSGGSLILELYSGIMRYKALGAKKEKKKTFVGGGHGDGDTQIMNELYDSMTLGHTPVCSGEEGLRSAIAGIAIDRAREEGTIIDLNETWKSMAVDLKKSFV